jgi:hypothetical protein
MRRKLDKLPRVQVIDGHGHQVPGMVIQIYPWKVGVLIASEGDPVMLPKDGSANPLGYRLKEPYDG